jgi:hypothetical protein
MRRAFAFPHVTKWMEETLPLLKAEMEDGTMSPLQQMDDLLHDFGSGEDLSFWQRSHSMNPSEDGIWELKTTDLRLFGWFKTRGMFVIANLDTAMRCKLYGLYAGYRGDCVRRRDALNLDPPKFMTGGYRDVL